ANFNNVNGCDSILQLDLSLVHVETTISVSATTLTADLEGAEYQWVDCNDDYSFIDGETNQSFIPLVSGNYAVIINDENCIDSSACYYLELVGIHDVSLSAAKIYPNPANDLIVIEFNELENIDQLNICNMIGEIVLNQYTYNKQSITVNIQLLNDGLYFITAGKNMIGYFTKTEF
ncbi:MAG: T9SS type A sorting domain-containing protein, partial [Chitinophagales bacterium]|nr:T9SS type A sorting domain-containing protein [Chitinophagales bacterium]